MARDPRVTSRIMAAVRGTDTKPEIALRSELHRRGLRYRVKSKVFGRPDLVFVRARVACFVDGDRWHGNGWQTRGYKSADEEFNHANAAFWKEKIARNMRRDHEVNERLSVEGWIVHRVWASEVERDLSRVADQVEALVRTRQGAPA